MPPPPSNHSPLGPMLAKLYARVPLGMRLGLDEMREALAANGNPERAAPMIHVAGTNGKGSTCAMLETMARTAGLRTGLYTSPHLARFAERIRIDGEPIDDGRLATHLEIALRSEALSFFETATLAAFLAFRQDQVDVAIMEVGIGGRLDATNVLRAKELRCAAVTKVALDHQDRLGQTLDEIAREKLAIGKNGVPIVLGPTVPDIPGATVGRIVRPPPIGDDIVVAMEGAHQRENAAIAWAIAQEIGIPVDARTKGLAKARWPGRFERIDGGRIDGKWILDGAHNPDGVRALVDALTAAQLEVGAIVFGALADKAWREMENELAALGSVPRFHAAPRGRPAAELPDTRPLTVALASARAAAGAERVVVVCGSIYLVGEARALLLGLPADPPVAL